MSFLRSLAVSVTHRTGLFGFLREQWRLETGEHKRQLEVLQKRADATERSIKQIQSGVPAEVELLRERMRALEREVRQLQKALTIDREQHTRWDELDVALDADAVLASVRRSVEDATIETQPMPHMVLRNVLPERTYQAVIESIPPDEFFPDRDLIKQNLKVKQLPAAAPAGTRRVLDFLETTIVPHMLTPALIERLRPHLEAVYASEYGAGVASAVAGVPHNASGARLMLRRPGYKLEPHLDPQRAVLTTLLYFARPGDNEAFGTQILEIDRPIVVDRTSTFYPRQRGYECSVVKTVPFAPNTALVFLNRGGAHAAEIPADAPADTRRYSYQFYVSPDGEALESVLGAGQAVVGTP